MPSKPGNTPPLLWHWFCVAWSTLVGSHKSWVGPASARSIRLCVHIEVSAAHLTNLHTQTLSQRPTSCVGSRESVAAGTPRKVYRFSSVRFTDSVWTNTLVPIASNTTPGSIKVLVQTNVQSTPRVTVIMRGFSLVGSGLTSQSQANCGQPPMVRHHPLSLSGFSCAAAPRRTLENWTYTFRRKNL